MQGLVVNNWARASFHSESDDDQRVRTRAQGFRAVVMEAVMEDVGSECDGPGPDDFGPVAVQFFEAGDEMSRLADQASPVGRRSDGRRSQALARRSLGVWVALAVIGLIALGISASYAQPQRTHGPSRRSER